jgi:hypothetical protein
MARIRDSRKQTANKWQEHGQSLIEVALTLPLLVFLFFGLVEVAFLARTYLGILEASREGARVGARGSANFDDTEIRTLVLQDLSRQGYTTATGLTDVIVVRAQINGPYATINSLSHMTGGNGTSHLTQAVLESRLQAGDPQGRLVAVEIFYDYRPLLGFPLLSDIFPDPLALHTYSIMRMLQ